MDKRKAYKKLREIANDADKRCRVERVSFIDGEDGSGVEWNLFIDEGENGCGTGETIEIAFQNMRYNIKEELNRLDDVE